MKSSIRPQWLCIIWVFLFAHLSIMGQQTSLSSGGNITGTSGSVSYSIGQTFYTTNTHSSGTVFQGIQHAYEIYALVSDPVQFNISLQVFPNPTSDIFQLTVSNYTSPSLSYALFDLQGKLLISGGINATQTGFDLNDLPPATYLLHVLEKNQSIQVFKIIKI
jgi:hypothetical protein